MAAEAVAKARAEAAAVATSELNQMLSMLLKAQKLTEEHKVLAQQKAEERVEAAAILRSDAGLGENCSGTGKGGGEGHSRKESCRYKK